MYSCFCLGMSNLCLWECSIGGVSLYIDSILGPIV
jgi:hypothetical protein